MSLENWRRTISLVVIWQDALGIFELVKVTRNSMKTNIVKERYAITRFSIYWSTLNIPNNTFIFFFSTPRENEHKRGKCYLKTNINEGGAICERPAQSNLGIQSHYSKWTCRKNNMLLKDL